VPLHLRNAPTRLMKNLGYGKDYRYAHDEEGGFAAGETYLPEGVAAPAWYQPTERGLEARIRERLEELRRLNASARNATSAAPDVRTATPDATSAAPDATSAAHKAAPADKDASNDNE
jgi:putative ATPase